jgi:hypothetical protein
VIVRAALVLGVAVIAGAVRSGAQNRGVYPLGMSATSSGVTPAAGFSYGNQLLYFARDAVKDDDGVTLPIGGLNAVLMDMNSFIWASRGTILGARYSATATIPVATNSLTSDVRGEISGGSGLADSYFLPIILGWDHRRVSLRAMYGVLAPTGRFEAGADDNVGSGYWTHTLSSGQTLRLSTRGALVVSLFEMYERHTSQRGTDVRAGDTFDLDYSVMRALALRDGLRLELGLAGYVQRQTTATVGPNVSPESAAERYAVNALGVAVTGALPRRRVSVALKYFDEFANRATFEGYSVQLAGAIGF